MRMTQLNYPQKKTQPCWWVFVDTIAWVSPPTRAARHPRAPSATWPPRCWDAPALMPNLGSKTKRFAPPRKTQKQRQRQLWGPPIIQQKPKCFEPTWHVECEVRLRAKTYFRVFVSYKTHRIATNIHLSPNQCIKMKQMPKNWLSQDSYFLSTCLV